MKKLFLLFLLLPMFLVCTGFAWSESVEAKKDFIRWIDFNVKKDILAAAQTKHKKFTEQNITDIGTCELLAYCAVKNGNKFNISKDIARLRKLTPEDVRKYTDNKYFKYYADGYHAVLDGIIDPKTGETIGFFPLAKGWWYNHSDDFGNSREYGFKRRHLGNDLFGSTGTPVIAVEGGIVSELGWNRYGGWRVGIRSCGANTDENPTEDYDAESNAMSNYPTRYYYYAHLRKGRPFAEDLKKGDRVEAGDVIGYLGSTGYSRKEDVNMKGSPPHLHFGIQIIFDKSQEDGSGELWIDVYELNKFLTRNRARVVRDPVTKEYKNVANSRKYLWKMFD